MVASRNKSKIYTRQQRLNCKAIYYAAEEVGVAYKSPLREARRPPLVPHFVRDCGLRVPLSCCQNPISKDMDFAKAEEVGVEPTNRCLDGYSLANCWLTIRRTPPILP